MTPKYINWLKEKGRPLFQGAGTYWTLYHGAIIPASPAPSYIDITPEEARLLLKESGALFIRYAGTPCDFETEWWHIVCDHYKPEGMTAKTRQNVKRGNRECIVRQVDAEWIATHGYECYAAAFERYSAQKPVSEVEFHESIIATNDGPFAYWGVFYKEHLAGYCQCIVDEPNVITNVTKYHPAYLKHRSAYALVNGLIQTYVATKGLFLSNGSRSISHNTNYQEVLINLGFQKKYCHLNIIYNPWLKIGVDTLYPVRSLISMMPDRNIVHKIRAILYQEEIRRSCHAR